jgi:hypothetical protein
MVLRRRGFLKLIAGGAVLGLTGCPGTLGEPGGDPGDPDGGPGTPPPGDPDAAPGTPPPAAADAAPGCDAGSVVMYDTYAMALYMDGSLGPETGVIEVEFVIAGALRDMDFWHGHGGVLHRFTLLPEHFEALKRGERVDIATTEVEGHHHMLFIDPTDPQWRVEGATPVEVPLACE